MEEMTTGEHHASPSLAELENRNAALKRRSTELERQFVELNDRASPPIVDENTGADLDVAAVIDPISSQGQRTVLASLIGSILGLKNKD